MSKIAVVYWSGTGNTEAMANEVAEGAKAAGAEVDVLTASEFGADKMDAYDAVAFGCPAMGAEELEDSEFEPMFSDCEGKLGGKKIALFGSYGWGDGEWMRTWEETCKADGAVLACDSVLANEAPDDDAVAACQALGKALCYPTYIYSLWAVIRRDSGHRLFALYIRKKLIVENPVYELKYTVCESKVPGDGYCVRMLKNG